MALHLTFLCAKAFFCCKVKLSVCRPWFVDLLCSLILVHHVKCLILMVLHEALPDAVLFYIYNQGLRIRMSPVCISFWFISLKKKKSFEMVY